jgi:predicted small secreted protein
MNGTSHRSTAAALGSLVLLAAAALAGCATTGGASTDAPAMGSGVRPPAVTTTNAYVVCSGGSASRFPEREEAGRVCRPTSTLLHAIY